MNLKRQISLMLLAFCLAIAANAQEQTQGLKLPRLTTVERSTISDSGSPYAKGQTIYNTDTNCLEYWNGEDWVSFCAEVTPYVEPVLPPKDETGQYRLSGKTCYDVAVTDFPAGSTCMPLTSRVNDFAGGFTFNYTFSGLAAYDITDYYAVGDGRNLVNLSRAGDVITATFVGNVRDLATNTTKTLTLIVTFDDANNDPKYIAKDISVQDCACGCTVDKAGGGTLTFMCYNLGVPESTKLLSPQEQANTESPTYPNASTSAPDSTIYGALYQWGRKSDGHQMRTSPTYTGTSLDASVAGNLDANGQVLLSDAVGRFIHGEVKITSVWDWRDNPQDNKLWDLNENGQASNNPSKSVNDPCPDGWRVPTYGEWNSICTVNTRVWQDAAAGKTAGLLFTPTGASQPTLFLPAAGERSYTTGAFSRVGTLGYYWSSSTNSQESYDLYISNGTGPIMPNYPRASGLSVRCVSEY